MVAVDTNEISTSYPRYIVQAKANTLVNGERQIEYANGNDHAMDYRDGKNTLWRAIRSSSSSLQIWLRISRSFSFMI